MRVQAVQTWQDANLQPSAQLRASTLRDRSRAQHEVTVTLPGGGGQRSLAPGVASLILKGVIEQWATARLRDPVVLTISEPGDKVYIADAAKLRALGITLDAGALLPDAVIVDLGDGTQDVLFWIVEAVATDGPVTDQRRLMALAEIPQRCSVKFPTRAG